MMVVKHSVNSPRLYEKIERYDPILIEGLTKYFQMKNYGEGVKEISYVEILVPDELGEDDSPKIVFSQEKKIISCIIQPEYKRVVRININKYGLLIAECYLRISAQFSELKVKDFDVVRYVEDLKDFFKQNNLL
jgi:hypothetical protein